MFEAANRRELQQLDLDSSPRIDMALVPKTGAMQSNAEKIVEDPVVIATSPRYWESLWLGDD